VKKAKEMTGKQVFLVTGGFHLGSHGESSISGIVTDFRSLGVEKVAPSHCSGDLARNLFKQEYENNFVQSGVGKKFKA
jgi:7,8-dihydropterin-6-yl-methyl-4-(beta-D-ribofuranosyl)aminobenzene 5'-phosphate synthase